VHYTEISPDFECQRQRSEVKVTEDKKERHFCSGVVVWGAVLRNCVFSLQHCMLLCQQTQNTFKLSPGRSWTNIHSQSDRLYASDN